MRWVIAFLLILLPDRAFGQSNFEGAQIGGRTTLMGGAGVATGSDEATSFVNPASITRIPGQSFSFSTFTVDLANRKVKNALDPSGTLRMEDADAGKINLRIIPNTFCLFLDGPPKDNYSSRSRHKYSLCAAATERERLNLTQNRFDSRGEDGFVGFSQSTDMEFVRSTVALSWGISLDKNASLGVTFRTDNTRFQDHTTATAFVADSNRGAQQTLSLARETWSWDTSVTIGVTYNISKVVTFGAALTTPSQHLIGKYTSNAALSFGVEQGNGIVQDTGDFRYNSPGNLRLGLAFSWPRLTVEVNGSFYGPQKRRAFANFDRRVVAFDSDGNADTAVGRGSVSERGRAVTNLSIGGEYFVRSDFSALAGFGSDFSGLQPRLDQDIGAVLFRQQRDSLHASLGMSSYGSRGRLMLGVMGEYSWGDVLVADPALAVPKFIASPQTEVAVSLIISGQLNFITVVEAAERAAIPLSGAGGTKTSGATSDPHGGGQ